MTLEELREKWGEFIQELYDDKGGLYENFIIKPDVEFINDNFVSLQLNVYDNDCPTYEHIDTIAEITAKRDQGDNDFFKLYERLFDRADEELKCRLCKFDKRGGVA